MKKLHGQSKAGRRTLSRFYFARKVETWKN
nr:MAG TPA: hypothetical protein [Caudoviricetes sp.]DAI60284.1 MAG TPA: hypothetical protein [Caudoviricetes sp.]